MFEIKLDNKAIHNWLDDIAKRQIPFATAKALTDTAKHVGEDIANKTKETMNAKKWASSVRTSSIGGGIKKGSAYFVIPANKKDGLGKMKATVGTTGWQLAQQEAGIVSIRKPLKRKYIYIPIKPFTKLNLAKSSSTKPKKLLKNKMYGSFFLTSSKGNKFIYERVGKGKWNIKARYKVQEQQPINPKFSFNDEATNIIKSKFSYYFNCAMKNAIKTAKK